MRSTSKIKYFLLTAAITLASTHGIYVGNVSDDEQPSTTDAPPLHAEVTPSHVQTHNDNNNGDH